MKLSEYLRKRRLTQREFATRVGVTQQMVGRWSTGVVLPGSVSMLLIQAVTRGAVAANRRDWPKKAAR